MATGAALLALASWTTLPAQPPSCGSGSGRVLDEAQCAGRTASTFPAADEDYFRDMDYGATKNPAEVAAALNPYVPGISAQDAVKAAVRGRNNWIVWSGGNDRFWDGLSKTSLGTLDFLKTLSSYPGPTYKYSRDNRWQYLGLVNEPCFKKNLDANGKPAGRPDRFGLYLDVRDPSCPPDPFENENKYPGVKIGARGKNLPIGSYYGYATGIVGLRLFPNPDFDENAAKRWDPERYYKDPKYYNNKDLVKPYRVGMSCGFCHIGPNPTKPPVDPENPAWENLNSNPGAQYFWVDRIFVAEVDESSFPYQLFHTSRPGGLDTSFISTDYINNPRTMNAVYSLGVRLLNAKRWGLEKLAGGGLLNKQFNEYLPGTPLEQFYQKPDTVWTPRVLKDGSDSVGALGALNRVYVNVGLFSEEWLTHFKPLVGGTPFTPYTIAAANKNSSNWNATQAQTPDVALFFLATTKPDYLNKASRGEAYLTKDQEQLARGKVVFAKTCARCHSSKLPEAPSNLFPNGGCVGPDYLKCWNDYWGWTKTDEFKRAMKGIVLKDDFLKDNFLSTDLRVPVTLLETNACASLATNAIAGNIWDNFSSQSYKSLPSVGTITVHHPLTGKPTQYTMPAGGRGYIRVPSLISIWSTAPYLLNNTVGGKEDFYWTGSVQDRMKSFDASIEKMLWPEKRKGELKYKTASGNELSGHVDVTSATSYLRVPPGYVPDFLKLLPSFRDGIEIGPIPKGTPVNLLSNMDLEQKFEVGKVLVKVAKDLALIRLRGGGDAQAREVFKNVVDPMLAVSKCPDFIVNRGHYFGTQYMAEEAGLSDQDKRALIEFLKTM